MAITDVARRRTSAGAPAGPGSRRLSDAELLALFLHVVNITGTDLARDLLPTSATYTAGAAH